MPINVPVGSYLCRLRFRYSGDPELMYITCGVRTPGAGGGVYADGAKGVAKKFFRSWADAFPAGSMISGWTLQGAEAQSGGGGADIGEYPNFVVGTADAGAPIPVNTAFLVKKKTALGGRRNRGRMFVPAGAYSSANWVSGAGIVAPEQLAKMGTGLDSFQTSLQSDNESGPPLDPVLFHQPGEALEGDPTLIIDFICDSKIATQRRRLRP